MKHKESLPFYHRKEWKRLREVALQRDMGMCQDCMELFRMGMIKHPRRADVVHHMIPVEDRPDLALNLDNLRSLCGPCHNRRHPEKGGDNGGRERTADEPVRRRMRIEKA